MPPLVVVGYLLIKLRFCNYAWGFLNIKSGSGNAAVGGGELSSS